ncbi:nitric oxide reductase transcriptional regulator NorR [Shewanella surugensis]|uniref:Nitric oxide reductase transcriptional regulator NorR n=1 Tax=Shewanella surugensis TaxID=212020 RepID=A0ABT0LA04_9GAMM|nr:nitric oxide reductase transcriptional regulator NorR [Shewanella surugensis]MCL1124523.1 nitric oxide reductase transcriptional regulator NorR [Shewanella surugensis]
MNPAEVSAILALALDLANSVSNQDRFTRLLSTIRKTIKCDAIALLQHKNATLKPMAIEGLSIDTLGRRFDIHSHPRLKIISQSTKPVTFSQNCDLPDPYDGLLQNQEGGVPIHACMGLPLYNNGHLLGIVTLDSLTPNSFDHINPQMLEIITEISAATMKTAIKLEQLEHSAKHSNALVQELTQAAIMRDGGEIIGLSPCIQALKNEIKLVAASHYSVLILGETGVGKELVAGSIHQHSHRHKKPMIQLNCASLPEHLAESEFFGHCKGAFTGAEKSREGKFQLADGGTLFLDEIGELPLNLQSKLLRALQSGEIQAVGEDKVKIVDVRVIAATNRNLKNEVTAGRFRADLYHRLSVYPIEVPPLRERGNDIHLLAGYFVENTARKLGISQLTLTPAALSLLSAYRWPGNVRELEHIISRAALKAKQDQWNKSIIHILPEYCDITFPKHDRLNSTIHSQNNTTLSVPQDDKHFPFYSLPEQSLKSATNAFQTQLIKQTLKAHDYNWAAAARVLETDRANLVRLAKRLGLSITKSI